MKLGIRFFFPLLAVSCASTSYLDRKVEKMLVQKKNESGGVTENSLRDAMLSMSEPGEVSIDEPLTATNTLHLAVQYNRDLQSQREALYKAALSTLKVRREASWQLSGTGSYELQRPDIGINREIGKTDFSLGNLLYSGADFSLRGDSTGTYGRQQNTNNVSDYVNNLSLRLEQPLLMGAGYKYSHESLIQAEKNLIYALRDFAEDRQNFSVQILRDFYDLVIQKRVLENTASNVEKSTYLRERSEALFKVQLAPYIDVLRSQQQEYTAINNYTNRENTYKTSVKRFLNELGIPVSQPHFKLQEDIPLLKRLVVDKEFCINVGMKHRFSLLTTRQQVEDAERKLRLAKRNLLPQLSIYGQSKWNNEQGDIPFDGPYNNDVFAGIKLDIPFDKRDERDALKTAHISLNEAKRNYDKEVNTVQIDIIDSYNRLKTLESNVKIEEQNTLIAEKRVENAFFRFKNGELSNRDVVEAENDLLDARNQYVRALVDHEIERYRLLRNMGLLDLTPEGKLVEVKENVEISKTLFAVSSETK